MIQYEYGEEYLTDPIKCAQYLLNCVAKSETDTIADYEIIKSKLCEKLKSETKLKNTLCKMLDKIIQDERNHAASVLQAAAVISGYKLEFEEGTPE